MMNVFFRFTPSNVVALKKALRSAYPQIKSSHFDEAIAASFGFNSYAAMRPFLHEVSRYARLVVQADHMLLLLRLEELGYHDFAPEELGRLMWKLKFPERTHDDKIEKAVQDRRRPTAANL